MVGEIALGCFGYSKIFHYLCLVAMLRSLLICTSFFCCTYPSASWAQSDFFPLGHLTTAQGLSQDFVTSIAQTKDGFMWFGTEDGLTRYDGSRCTVFRHLPGDTTSLPDNRISGLSVDPAGRLWVSTYKGLCYLNPSGRHFQRLSVFSAVKSNTIKEYYVSELAFDAQGAGWALADTLLMRLDIQTCRTTFFKIPCKTKSECTVYADSRGRIWVTMVGQHLTCYDTHTGKFTYVRGLDKPLGAKNPWPMSVKEDSKGVIWNADWDQAFYTYDEKRETFVPVPGLAPGIVTTFLLEERPDTPMVIWAGGGTHGLMRLDCANYQRCEFPLDPRDPFAHNNSRTYAIYRDPYTGIIWFGTEMGVEYYDPNALTFGRVLLPVNPNQSQFYSVSALMPDLMDANKYWLGIWGVGLYEWSRREGTFVQYDVANKGLYSNEIFDIARDQQGNLWFATLKGVERFDPRTKKRRHFEQPPPCNGPVDKALCVEVGSDGIVWSGSNRGILMQTNPQTGQVRSIELRQHNGQTFDIFSIWNLTLDRQGRVLVGAPNGLFRYDPATGKNEHLLYHTPRRYVSDAAQALDGHLYVGTQEGVLILNEQDSIIGILNADNGLRNQNVKKIEVDPQGNIWIATVNGLHRYSPKTQRIDYYSKENGLFLNNLSQGFNVLPNGELFVSGDYSFNIALSDQLGSDGLPPRLAIDAVKVLSRALDWKPGDPIVLQPGENVVTFHIALIHYTHPQKTSLSYRLVGFDETWTETRQPTITYTNLDGGQYTLQVRACNGDGVWSEQNLDIPIRVIAPFYKTWPFRALLVLALLGGSLGLVKYRLNIRNKVEAMQSRAKELEKQQLLNEIALLKTQVNPHFLFNSLSILSALIHIDTNLSEQFIDQLSRSYRYILEQKEQSLVTLRTELEFIRAYAFLLKIRFEQKFDLRIQLEEPLVDQYRIAPLTLQLLIENAVKHNRMSTKEPLVVEVYIEKDTLIVKNPLQTRPIKASSTGTGLNNIKGRYALLTDRPVEAFETVDGTFMVCVPLL